MYMYISPGKTLVNTLVLGTPYARMHIHAETLSRYVRVAEKGYNMYMGKLHM